MKSQLTNKKSKFPCLLSSKGVRDDRDSGQEERSYLKRDYKLETARDSKQYTVTLRWLLKDIVKEPADSNEWVIKAFRRNRTTL